MSFLSPLFLIGAVAAAIPILLHLFHRKTEVVIDFPAASLLKRAPVQQHRRRRLRELILLALRVTALLLLALSFARPYLTGASAPDSVPITVIAVDTSMSMTAPGQFARARDAAERAVAAAPSSHPVALVAFADAATVMVQPTTDRSAVTAEIARMTPGRGGTRYRTALARASEVIGDREGRVVVVTDLQQVGWEANDEGGLPDGVDVEVASVAPPAGNLAVTSAERRNRSITASIQNFGNSEVRATVRLAVGGRPITSADVTMAPFGAGDVELTGTLPAAGEAEVRVDDATGYQPDNVRLVTLDPLPPIRIGVVVTDPTGATGGLYLERALAVAGGGREFDVDVRDGREVAKWTPGQTSVMGGVFVLGTRTLDRAGREVIRTYLEQGGRVLLATGPDVDLGTLSDVVGAKLALANEPVHLPGATLVASDGRHPVFRPFLSPSGALGDVQVEQHRRLNDQPGRTVLARFSGGDAALAEQAVGKGQLLVFTSDLENQWSRFPLNPAFVPFVVETARYMTQFERSLRRSANGAKAEANAAESNPAATAADEFKSAIQRTDRSSIQAQRNAAHELEDRQRWWQVGLVLMLVALAGEALLGRRTT